MDRKCDIWVLNGKLASASADAIIMTIDPDRLFLRKIDREICGSQNGHGRAYYAQLPKGRVGNLDSFIAKRDYEIIVESDKYNIETCICPRCVNYDEVAKETGQVLLCSPDTKKSICRLAPTGCICQKCHIHERFYLLRKYYCMAEKAKLISDKKYPDLIFVSDRYVSRLSDLVLCGLLAADKAGYKNIALPPLRYEVMWKTVENSDKEKNREMAIGLNRFFLEHQDSNIESIKIIVDDDNTVRIDLIMEIEKHKILKTMLKNKKPGIAGLLKEILNNKKRSIFGT